MSGKPHYPLPMPRNQQEAFRQLCDVLDELGAVGWQRTRAICAFMAHPELARRVTEPEARAQALREGR